MDVSLKQRLIVDIRVMVPFITDDIIQTSWIEQGGGTPEPMGGFWGDGIEQVNIFYMNVCVCE